MYKCNKYANNICFELSPELTPNYNIDHIELKLTTVINNVRQKTTSKCFCIRKYWELFAALIIIKLDVYLEKCVIIK